MTGRLERLAARLRSQAGYTAVERTTVLAILGIVLGALTGAWVAGFRYQVDESNRYEAQEQARTAVDRMRKELHCATSLTYTSAASVTAALPGGCPFTTSVARNVTYSTAAAGSAYELRRARGTDGRAPDGRQRFQLHRALPLGAREAPRRSERRRDA